MDQAHAFGARYDLPIPLYLFVAGGAVVVLLSFAFVVPRAVTAAAATPAPDRPRLLKRAYAGGGIALVVLAFLSWCGITGDQEVAENILPTTFWLLVWIAVPLTCGLLGDWTQPVNPFAAVARWCDTPGLRKALLGSARPVGWPARLGFWPAVVLYFAAACGELIVNQTATTPHVLATGLLVYVVVCALGGLLFGQAFRQQGEVFTVLFATWGRLGWWRFGAPGKRGFGGGLETDFEASASRVAFVILLLLSVNFDGLLATPQWSRFEKNLPDRYGLDVGRQQIERTLTFLVLTVLVLAFFVLFAVWTARVAGRPNGPRVALTALLPSLLPIAFGYLLVHNLQYVLVNSQLMLPLIGNPTGQDSWPISLPFPFNDSFEPHPFFLPSSFYWYAGIVIIVVVHVIAVVIAHRRLGVAADADAAAEARSRRSELPWLVAMVAYTMASLWLIAQPLTEASPQSTTGAAATSQGSK